MRTDGDSWDIVTSVGLTALGVATFRALESAEDVPMIRDEYATLFVKAAGEPHFQPGASGMRSRTLQCALITSSATRTNPSRGLSRTAC